MVTSSSSLLVGADTLSRDAGTRQLVEKAASEVSIDDTTLDDSAPTETSDGG